MKSRTLNQTLGWLLATVIIPLLLGTLLLLYVQGLQEQRAAQRQLAVLAQTLMQTVDRELAVGREQLEVIAASPMVGKKDWLALQSFARDVTSRRPGNVIGFVEADGQQLFNTVSVLGQPQPNLWNLGGSNAEANWEGYSLPVSSQLLTKEVFDTGKPAYSDLYYGLNTRKPALAISIPIREAGAVRYALTLSFSPALLQQLIDSAVHEPGLRAAVIDRRGIVMASSAAASSKLGDKVDPLGGKPNSPVGVYERVARDGEVVQGAYAVSPINGFEIRVSKSSSTLTEFVSSSTAGWVAMVLSAIFASAFLARRAARRLSEPLRAMGDAARDGHTNALQTTRIAELDVLISALKTGALAEQYRREALVHEAQRTEALAALKRADEQKDEFLATLAHELRNPLAPIRTANELIRRAAPDDDRVRRPSDIIERQVGHMARLVDDLLDVSRISRGTVQLRTQPLDLVALTRAAADALRPVFAGAGLSLKEQPLAQAPTVVDGDAMRLTQCVNNLLNNAVKFTPRGGSVRFSVAQHERQAEIAVKDTGIGLQAESLDKIFELFAQEHPSGSGGNAGLGIGLALTRKLVEMHGGSINASSAGVGSGSTFRIRLPLATMPVPVPAQRDVGVEYARSVGTRILVVDDNVDAAESFAETLSLFGFSANVAYNGKAALQAAARSTPQAVLLDIGLPDMTGHEVARQLKEMDPSVVLIALSGWGQESDRQKSRESGFDAHLTKPADVRTVVDLLNELLTQRKLP
ncbi:MAG: ATP-binding protein [Pseudomonadota bacterium]